MDTLQILWEGADKSTWQLSDRSSPVQVLELEGLGLPALTQRRVKAAAFAGERYQGTTWGVGSLRMRVMVGDPNGARPPRTGDAWRELDRAWRRSVSAETPGKLVVISGAGRRELAVRLEDPIAPPAGVNPGLRGLAVYDYSLTADDQPWWAGEEVTAEFVWSSGGEPFFGGLSGDVLFFISPSSQTESATITNPGDREAWPRWYARGPFDEVEIGVGDKTVTLPFGVARDGIVLVDSYEQTITDVAGNSLWRLMGFSNPTFAPIPAGAGMPLVTRLTGASAGAAVGLSLTPLYEAPW